MSGYNLRLLYTEETGNKIQNHVMHLLWRTALQSHVQKCSRGFFEAAWATRSDPVVCRVRGRRPSPGKHRASRRLNCNLIMLWLWETIQMVSHYKGCVCVQATLILMRPKERRETATVCRTENRWHAVMRLCHSLSENKTLLFICHLLQLSLYPLSVSP